MTGLEKWKKDEMGKIEKADLRVALNSIWYRIDKCKYCKYHINKECIKGMKARAMDCLDGMTEYLEGEVRK